MTNLLFEFLQSKFEDEEKDVVQVGTNEIAVCVAIAEDEDGFPHDVCVIVKPEVFCLGEWSPLLPTRFLVSRGTLDSSHLALPFAYRTLTFCGLPFQVVRLGLTRLMLVRNPG